MVTSSMNPSTNSRIGELFTPAYLTVTIGISNGAVTAFHYIQHAQHHCLSLCNQSYFLSQYFEFLLLRGRLPLFLMMKMGCHSLLSFKMRAFNSFLNIFEFKRKILVNLLNVRLRRENLYFPDVKI